MVLLIMTSCCRFLKLLDYVLSANVMLAWLGKQSQRVESQSPLIPLPVSFGLLTNNQKHIDLLCYIVVMFHCHLWGTEVKLIISKILVLQCVQKCKIMKNILL